VEQPVRRPRPTHLTIHTRQHHQRSMPDHTPPGPRRTPSKPTPRSANPPRQSHTKITSPMPN
jgi:hypothetical protein